MHWVSLITDFGIVDPYLGQIKGAIWSKQPEVLFIDITHSIKPHDIVSAGWILKNTYKDAPKATIHVISVLNNYNNNAAFLVFEYDGHFFVGPNNGVFSLAFEKLPREIFEVKSSNTFSVKQLLSHIIDHLLSKRPLDEIGPEVKNLIMRIQLQPVMNKYMIRGSVIFIDHYENVVLNITRSQFEHVCNGREFSLYIKRNDPIVSISKTYQDVPVGETLCLFNSFDYLEIAINSGTAASMLGLQVDDMVQIDFQ